MHPTPHDALFKAAFSDPGLAREVLAAVLGPPLAEQLDLSSLTLVSGDFVDEALQGRHADLVFSATLAGHPALVYVLYEHQSTDDRWMGLRVLTYKTRLRESLRKSRPDLALLPPIVSVVLFHGARPWRSPRHFEALIDPPPGPAGEALLPHVPRFCFVLHDLGVAHDALPQLPARARLVLQALQHTRLMADVAQRFRELAPTLRQLKGVPGAITVVRQVFRHIGQVRGLTDRKIIDVIATEVGREEAKEMQTLAEMWIHEGEVKGHRKGHREGERSALLRQLRRRFGSLPAAVLAQIEQADEDALERWLDAILDARSLDELFPPR